MTNISLFPSDFLKGGFFFFSFYICHVLEVKSYQIQSFGYRFNVSRSEAYVENTKDL